MVLWIGREELEERLCVEERLCDGSCENYDKKWRCRMRRIGDVGLSMGWGVKWFVKKNSPLPDSNRGPRDSC